MSMLVARGWYLALAGLSAAALPADPCAELQNKSAITKQYGVQVSDDITEEIPVTVWGEGGSARAAAALLVALLQYSLGYAAHFTRASPIICNFTVLDNWRRQVVVAPAILPAPDCAYGDHDSYNLTAYNRTTIAYSLQLLAHVADQRCIGSMSDLSYVNASILENCNFEKANKITSNRFCKRCFVVLARNESYHDNLVIDELRRRIDNLKLPLNIEYYQNDLHLRKTILQMQKQKKSFLFLDEDIWRHVPGIMPVKHSTCIKPLERCATDLVLESSKAVVFGVGDDVKQNAFPIWQVVTRFSPTSEDLREILEHEKNHDNDTNIEKAACSWALKNENVVKNWTSNYQQHYIILTYLCKFDTDLDEQRLIMKNYSNFIPKNIFKLAIAKVNCFDTEDMLTVFNRIAADIEPTFCVIAWGWSVTPALIHAANYWQLPLLLMGPTMPDEPLNSSTAVHSTTAPLTNLIQAYIELLKRCGWSRIAILSDDSAYSDIFAQSLLSKKQLLYRERRITLENIDSSLDTFREEDARIFIVNTNSSIAHLILCTALKKGMTPAAGIMWIVRDWRAVHCSEGDITNSMYHVTLGLSWRGGPTKGGSTILQNSLREIWKIQGNELAGSFGSASLLDAMQLSYEAFASLHDHPAYKYGSYKRKSHAKYFSRIMKQLSINGTAHELRGNSDETLVFVEKWSWRKGESVALWSVTSKDVLDVGRNTTEASTCDKIFGSQPLDRQSCSMFTSGDEFAPRCHTTTVITVIIILTIAAIALTVARRARLTKLRRLRIQSQENQVASWLERFLVKRNLITLHYEIGSGCNGRVSFGELRLDSGAVVVAAKEPRNHMNEILHEACILAKLNHKNIIRLVGVCLEDGPAIALMEHALHSDLQKYLILHRHLANSDRNSQVATEEAMRVSDSELTRFAREAAGGLEYLADKRIIHRDVRAANCLVDENRSLKLADFSMARDLDSEDLMYTSTRRGLFPVLWMPPESLREGIFSTASDIWALGVLILEVATLGARPYCDWSLERVVHFVQSGGHPPLPPDISKDTRSLLLECWQVDVKSRPTAAFINKFLTRNPHAVSRALLSPDIPEPLIPFSFHILKDKIES